MNSFEFDSKSYPNHTRIFAFLLENWSKSPPEIAKWLDISITSIYMYMNRMHEKWLVEKNNTLVPILGTEIERVMYSINPNVLAILTTNIHNYKIL
jgi:predicted transcriptional regulator